MEPAVLATGQTPSAIAAAGGDVYWSNPDGSVRHVRADGGPVSTLVPALGGAFGALVVDGDHLYWVDAHGGRVVRAPRRGGAPQTLASEQEGPVALAVRDDWVYWVNRGAKLSSGEGAVMKVRTRGGTPTTLVSSSTLRPTALAIDDRFLYWVNSHGTASTIERMPLRGGRTVVLARRQNSPQALVAGAGRVTWVNGFSGDRLGPGKLQDVAATGRAHRTLASGLPGPLDLVVDAGDVYWTQAGSDGQGAIMFLPRSSRAPVVLAQSAYPCALAIDAANLYWISCTGGDAGAVMALARQPG